MPFVVDGWRWLEAWAGMNAHGVRRRLGLTAPRRPSVAAE
jgi:hypothetical protein